MQTLTELIETCINKDLNANPSDVNPCASPSPLTVEPTIKAQIFVATLNVTCSQVPCWTQVGFMSVKQWNCLELEARSQLSAFKGVKGRAEVLGWD